MEFFSAHSYARPAVVTTRPEQTSFYYEDSPKGLTTRSVTTLRDGDYGAGLELSNSGKRIVVGGLRKTDVGTIRLGGSAFFKKSGGTDLSAECVFDFRGKPASVEGLWGENRVFAFGLNIGDTPNRFVSLRTTDTLKLGAAAELVSGDGKRRIFGGFGRQRNGNWITEIGGAFRIVRRADCRIAFVRNGTQPTTANIRIGRRF
ncbi:hypothetical protein COX84_00300 [Candidatus Micrarchaeota archaeon CG_4_10_14_0_2_um_filter_49_7]|nr:MAG: hypothetical protein COX84_00300 [Candidatus Micrarchaeota archaeon CG_4_10_14_0_2_um_filter_49_7]